MRESKALTQSNSMKGVAVDVSMLSTAVTCLTAATDIGKSITGIRDATVANTKVIEIQELLLKAQQSLFGHGAELQRLQQENFDLRERLRGLESEALNKLNYTLVELKTGCWAMARLADKDVPNVFVPNNYVCQPCFSAGREVVLQRGSFYGAIHFDCPVCKTRVISDETATNV